MITDREQEVQQLCEAADLTVEATALTPKSVIVTIKPLRGSFPQTLKKLARAMNDQGTPCYAVTQIGMPGAPIRELRFEELS